MVEDKARVVYRCDSCGAGADLEADVKHKDGCKPKFGSGVRKACGKSGTPPHVKSGK